MTRETHHVYDLFILYREIDLAKKKSLYP